MTLLPYYLSLEKPSKFQLLQKDMAVNLADGKLYFKDLNQQVQEFDISSVERIGNHLNYALKYPDGTLICIGEVTLTSLPCTTSDGALYRNVSTAFPLTPYVVKFVGELPQVHFQQKIGEVPTLISKNVWSNTLSDFRAILHNTTSASISLTLSYTAIGRWKL